MAVSGNVTDPGDSTLRALLERGWGELAGSSVSARLDAEVLLAYALRRQMQNRHGAAS